MCVCKKHFRSSVLSFNISFKSLLHEKKILTKTIMEQDTDIHKNNNTIYIWDVSDEVSGSKF